MNWALVGGEVQLHAPAALPSEKNGTKWIGGWVGPRVGVEDLEKREFLTLPGLELRPLGRPAHNQSLYRLRYPGISQCLEELWCYKIMRTILILGVAAVRYMRSGVRRMF
jgi:hypothetical protein